MAAAFVLVLGAAAVPATPLAPTAAFAIPCNHYNDCDDKDPCNGFESCTLGECASGPLPDCDDHNVCTDDFCQPGSGCMNPPNRASCSDHNPCNGEEYCAGTKCKHTPALDCDDGNECTTDVCDVAFGCANVPNTEPCDDHGCVVNGVCADGECEGQPLCDPECERCVAGECVERCGEPGGAEPTASDALVVLQAAVEVRACALCVCDVNGDREVTVTDALFVLAAAVKGDAARRECPVPTTSTTTTTTTTSTTDPTPTTTTTLG